MHKIWGCAIALLGVVQARSQTSLPATDSGANGSAPNVAASAPALDHAATLSLSAGEATALSFNTLYSPVSTPTFAAGVSLTAAPDNSLSLLPFAGLTAALASDNFQPNTWYASFTQIARARDGITFPALTATLVQPDTAAITRNLDNSPGRLVTETVADDGDPIASLEISNLSVITIPTNAPTPEPSALALLALGAGVLRWNRHSRRA